MNPTSETKFSGKFLRRVFIGLFILLLIALIGILYRIIEFRKLQENTKQQSVTTVEVVIAKEDPKVEEIIIPGTVLAWHETTIFARTNGYVINWYADFGSRVKEGDLLAEITTPEIDAQLRQTEAQLKTAEANYELAKITATRWKFLLKTNSVSKQETDEKVLYQEAQAALVASTRANRDRLRELSSFQKVTAPFDGIISSRTTDIGRLINAGSNGNYPLFRIVQSNRLRVYVRLPQIYSSRIRPDLIAQLYFVEHPRRMFPGKLLDTAGAVDHKTRTLLVQFEVDNSNYELFPGSYTEAHLFIPTLKNAVILPVNTLIFQKYNLQVAIVTKDNRAIRKAITLGRDYGNEVEVVAGIMPGDKVILNPPDALISGQYVRLASSARKIPQGKKVS